MLKLFLLSAWIFSCQSFSPYHTKDFIVPALNGQVFISTILISSDFSMMVAAIAIGTSSTKPFYLYKIDRGDFQLFNEVVQSDSSTPSTLFVRGDRNLETIVAYKTVDRKASIFRRNGNLLNEVQLEFTPHSTTSLNSIQISMDGSSIIFASNSILVSYQWSGTSYDLMFNGTITNPVSFRTLTPDGHYLIYGQTGTLNLRILNNSNPIQEIILSNLVPTGITMSSGGISWIGVGKSQPGKYDIVCRYTLNGDHSVMYIQFDQNINSILKPLPEPFPNPNPTSNIYLSFYVTQNGKYVAIMQRSILRLYEKQLGNYVEIQNATRVSNMATLYFVAEDASLIVIRPASNLRINFLFKCDIQNCLKCLWINLCQICNQGYVLIGNACLCPPGTFKLSGACVNCSISNCVACTANNLCSRCGNGYSLVDNTCLCLLPMNISQTTQRCVTCNVANCYRCSSDDICEVFSPMIPNPTNFTNDTQNGSNSTVNQTSAILSNTEKTSDSVARIESIVFALVIVIGLMLVGMLIIGFFLIKLTKQVSNASVKPDALKEQTLSGQKNETFQILREEGQNQSHENFFELPPDFNAQGQTQEEMPTDFFQTHSGSQPIVNVMVTHESLLKCKQRKRRKLNQLKADYNNDVADSQSFEVVLPVNGKLSQVE